MFPAGHMVGKQGKNNGAKSKAQRPAPRVVNLSLQQRPKSAGYARAMKSPTTLTFAKQDVVETPKQPKSVLSSLLSEAPIHETRARSSSDVQASHGSSSSSLQTGFTKPSHFDEIEIKGTDAAASSSSSSSSAAVPLTVPFHCSVYLPSGRRITFTLGSACPLSHLLLYTLRNCIEANNLDELRTIAELVELRVADPAGQVDEDMPALDERRPVQLLGVKTFVLCPVDRANQLFQELEPAEAHLSIGFASNRSAPAAHSKHGNTNKRPLKKNGVLSQQKPSSRLFRAAETGAIDVFRELVDNELVAVDVRGIDNFTALHFAARKGHLPIVSYILRKFEETDIDAQTKNGWTPLHLAVDQGHYDVVELLCSYGASNTTCNNSGHTPGSLAQQKGLSDIVDLLKEFSNIK